MRASAGPLDRLASFFGARVWEERLSDLPWAKAVLYRVARVAHASYHGFFEHRLMVQAAALTYYTVLSIVPFLAFSFALLKGFGAYRAFVQGTVRPYLTETFSPNPELLHAIERVLGFVEATDFSRVGAIGLLFLVYTSVTLVSSVESALNEVFGAKTARSRLRQVTDYVTMLVTTPILVLVATTLASAAHSSSAVRFVREQLHLALVVDFAFGLAPIVAVALALFAMYLILPNVRTRPLSAAIGAVLGAAGWQTVLVLHVELQLGVARANAIYSVLSALPIFLVWAYVSWLVVLAGAEVAASHQNEQAMRERLHGIGADQELKEMLAVALASRIARDFLDGAAPRGAAELAASLEISPSVVDDVLAALVRAGVLLRAVSGGEVAYVPGRDPDDILASDVRGAVRRDPRVEPVRATLRAQLGPELGAALPDGEGTGRASSAHPTLRELAALVPGRRGGPERRRGDRDRRSGNGGSEGEVLDAKQPDAPS